jgi:hypothetical protein
MKTSTTRAWTRRFFNQYIQDFGATTGLRDKVIRAEWRAYYGPPCNSIVRGTISGLRGVTSHETGVFERNRWG